jgi:ubiquinone/menaquinone biosynthesis C-methylase UbiE
MENNGDRFYRERSAFLAYLLNKIGKELKILTTFSSSQYLLDIGCGKGDLTEKISGAYDFKAVGVDLAKRLIFNSRVSFLTADACSLPFKEKSFVLVAAFNPI